MVTYKYTALSAEGAKVSGVIDAVDEFAAVARIKAQYPVVVKIDPVVKSEALSFLSKDINKKVDQKALSVMCSQFSIMLESGLNIAVCMDMIGNQTEDKKLRQMLKDSAQDVAQGASVASSFAKNCEGLPVTFIETVRAGEMSGTLENSFRRMNDVEIEYRQTTYGTKLLVAREVGSDTDFVDIMTVYKGYMIEFNMTPSPQAAEQRLTDSQVAACIQFLSDLDFVPVNK